ncbi:glutaminyl-peptide cyclotransferase [Chryseobacterium sp. SC28]|uniref:glutaminyl-peptide cyclotransferase n=1 Tax=Chryseobacterium sp. SC28 TaxID=2268028 RepID=UPI000F646420|nr:glutaminyl-peptide cyclotransferase [Chryseobacterium sp. SC28]RRQ46353.1 glutaminyl-peptide cyclotransferase [Chryseobacterium sp. SC28]
MKKIFLASAFALLILVACNKDKEILNSLNDYNLSRQDKGYHFGDKIQIPQDVLEYADAITISLADQESSSLIIDPKFFTLGENDITFNIKIKNGEVLQQDATINVFAKTKARAMSYEIVNQYPHDPKNFVQGFQLDGNIVYESDGQTGQSRILKYNLGTTTPLASTSQPQDVFSEGSAIVGDKIYQLTWQNKKGFIYDKNSLKLIKEFPYDGMIGEGWGLTYDGKELILSDGTKNLYFLNPENPSKVVRYISVASDKEAYDQLNELEYHNGSIYANVWQKPIILQINPANGEVTGILDLSNITKQNTTGNDDVLNGIAFKGDNMLITGKNWSRIYEIAVK